MEPVEVAMKYPIGKPKDGIDVLWRLDAKRYSIVIDADSDHYGVTDPQLEMWWYKVRKRTRCGAWIDDKFVKLTATKKWACATEADAIESFRRRKEVQISIYKNRLAAAKADLKLLEKGLFE